MQNAESLGSAKKLCKPCKVCKRMLIRAPDTPAAELEALAAQVRQLRPDWRSAEDFYERRSEIIGGLRKLSRRLAGRSMPAPVPMPQRPRPVLIDRATTRHAAPTPPARGNHPPAPPPAVARATTRPRTRPSRWRYPRPPRTLAEQGKLPLISPA
jgi:hypothetical protein